jgi:hypothetical protein
MPFTLNAELDIVELEVFTYSGIPTTSFKPVAVGTFGSIGKLI